MRFNIVIVAATLLFTGAGAAAETVELNHLDCHFNESTQAIDCPEVLPTGRSSAEPAVAEASTGPADEPNSSDGKPAKGTAEWNAYCAAKYNSFNPETGTYTSYSGKTRPCR